ncbi:MAG: peptidase S1 [Deltaproteobacteria bacterium]|nr:MAG: peptidase S1 [Deltaproteobacteria bacterium]
MLGAPFAAATVTLALVAPAAAADDAPTHFTLDVPPQGIYGGTEVEPCGWPTTVNLQGSCTGTLIHPEVVIYAAHCGTGYSSIQFGENINGGVARNVPVEYCKTYPGGGPGNGDDFAFCKLAEPQLDIPIVPPLMGCETDVLQPGAEVTIVGFGNADNGPYGIKREVTTTINSVTNEAFIGGNGKDSCQGDSGGPVFIKLPTESGVGSWRVFGITSYGGACGTGGYYSMMHNGMEWFESETGIDLTPCHDADGTWNPGPDCGMFPMDAGSGYGSWAEGCSGGPLGGFESSCGQPFGAEPDDTPPTVTITMPADGSMFTSDPDSGKASITISATADDGDGWGIESVTLQVGGADVPGGGDFLAPYEWDASFPPGIYTLTARARDYAGNEAVSAPVVFGVDMEPPPPPPETTGSSGGGTGGDGGGDGGSAGTEGGTSGTGGTDGVGQASGDDGCGCRFGPSDRGAAGFVLGLLGVAGLRRRRR